MYRIRRVPSSIGNSGDIAKYGCSKSAYLKVWTATIRQWNLVTQRTDTRQGGQKDYLPHSGKTICIIQPIYNAL